MQLDRRCRPLLTTDGLLFQPGRQAIYLTMALILIAQATNTHLTLVQQITLLGVLLLTSKGAAGVAGSGFVVLAATSSATHSVPVAGLTLILGIDRFMSEARALTNVIGNGVACLIIARWTGESDLETVQRGLQYPGSWNYRLHEPVQCQSGRER
jgi:aerobic C4-dicarboxylate transport protein